MNLNKKRKHEYKKMYKDRNNNYDCEHLNSLLGAYFSCLLVSFIDCSFFQFTASTSIIFLWRWGIKTGYKDEEKEEEA